MEEAQRAQGTASRMMRLASVQAGHPRALCQPLIDPEKRVRTAWYITARSQSSVTHCSTLLAWHSPCTLNLIYKRLCGPAVASGGPFDIETARGHGMATSPEPMDMVFDTFMVELHAIHERAALARRFHQLMGQCSHIEIPVQYERLYLRSLAQPEEPSNDDPRGHQHRRRKRLPHARI